MGALEHAILMCPNIQSRRANHPFSSSRLVTCTLLSIQFKGKTRTLSHPIETDGDKIRTHIRYTNSYLDKLPFPRAWHAHFDLRIKGDLQRLAL